MSRATLRGASPGGPRYDPSLTSEQRSAANNAIWLCQTCGKLIDSDLTRYTTGSLREWKRLSEQSATQALESGRSPDGRKDNVFSKVERLMPDLLAEMRTDILQSPLCREFVVLRKSWVFWYPEGTIFTYYYEDHAELDNKLQLLQNLRLIRDVRGTSVVRHK